MKHSALRSLLTWVVVGSALAIGFRLSLQRPAAASGGPMGFELIGERALAAMRQRAEELNIKGVAVASYSPGVTVTSWSSKMTVVGHLADGASDKSPGNNLLAIAYSKSAEMAETLKDSGNSGRKPMTGEFGWKGGVVARGKTGLLICAFSGGKSEDDVKVSQAGLVVLESAL